ncbi:uncharacterized [Tachysurus ichikawai]
MPGVWDAPFYPVLGTIQSHLRPSRALAAFEWPLWVIRASLKRALPLTQSSGLVGHRWQHEVSMCRPVSSENRDSLLNKGASSFSHSFYICKAVAYDKSDKSEV